MEPTATNTLAEKAFAALAYGVLTVKFAVGLEHPTMVETLLAKKKSIPRYRVDSWLKERADARAEEVALAAEAEADARRDGRPGQRSGQHDGQRGGKRKGR